MSNIYEFVLQFTERGIPALKAKANEMLSAVNRNAGTAKTAVAAIAIAASTMGSGVSSASTNAASSIGNIGDAADKAAGKISNLHSSVGKLNNGGGGFKDMAFGSFAGNLASRGVERGLSFAVDQLTETLGAGMEGSMIKAQYQTLNGDVAGNKLYGGLTKYIQDSIFGNELYGEATLMNGFGFKAPEILPELKMLGDISMGNKAHLSGLTLVDSQVKGQGKMQAQDWHQFINAGFNPLQVISEKTGKSMASLMDAMSDGKISFDMVHQSLIWATEAGGRFHNMLDKIGETPFGKYQADLGNIDNAKLQLGTALLPAVGKVLDAFKPMIDQLPGMMDGLATEISKIIDQWLSYADTLPNLAQTWINAIMGLIKGLSWLGGVLVSTVSFLYNNWVWLKYVIGIYAAFRLAIAAASTYLNAYNLIVSLTTARTVALAVSEGEATTATIALDAAMAATPWGVIALGIAGVVAGLIALNKASSAIDEHNLKVDVANATAERDEAYMKVQNPLANMVAENDPYKKNGYELFRDARRFMNGTELYSMLESRLSDNDYRKKMMPNMQRLFSDAASDTSLNGSLQLPKLGGRDKDTIGGGYSEKWQKLLGWLNDKESKLFGAASTTNKGDKKAKEMADAIADTGSSISGGGVRQLHIHMKNMVENIYNNPSNSGEAVSMTEGDVKNIFYRIIAGVPA